MNKRPSIRIAALAGLALAFASAGAAAWDADAHFSMAAGIEYANGDYGGDSDIEDLYVPLTGAVEYGNVAFRLTLPYLSVRAPLGTVITRPGGQPFPGAGATTTESGLGDIVGGITLYDVVRSRDLGIALDVTGKVKFATADEDKGLGTGEADYSLQADVYKFFDDFTLLGGAGYKVRGDPADVDLENTLFGSVGVTFPMAQTARGGAIFDYRESSFEDGDAIRELTVFVSSRVQDAWSLTAYALTGFSDSSPDFVAGFRVKRAY